MYANHVTCPISFVFVFEKVLRFLTEGDSEPTQTSKMKFSAEILLKAVHYFPKKTPSSLLGFLAIHPEYG